MAAVSIRALVIALLLSTAGEAGAQQDEIDPDGDGIPSFGQLEPDGNPFHVPINLFGGEQFGEAIIADLSSNGFPDAIAGNVNNSFFRIYPGSPDGYPGSNVREVLPMRTMRPTQLRGSGIAVAGAFALPGRALGGWGCSRLPQSAAVPRTGAVVNR